MGKIQGTTKLQRISAPTTNARQDETRPEPRKRQPTSFRLFPQDRQRLKEIHRRVNTLSNYKHVSELDVIRALIAIGFSTKPELIFKKIKEIM